MDKKKIAFFSTGWSSQILAEYIAGMQDVFSEDNVDIFLFVGYPQTFNGISMYESELNIFKLPNLADFDGAVVFSSSINYPQLLEGLLERCRESGIPTISRGVPAEGLFYSDVDNKTGMRDLCNHLIKEHGVKNPCFIAGSGDSLDSNIRYETFREVLKENKIEFNEKYFTYTDWDNYRAVDFLNTLKETGSEFPDAFVCANDGLAMAVIMTLNKMGYKVPEDIIVTGFDNLIDAQRFYPAVASVDQRFRAMGKQGAMVLLEEIKGITHEDKHLMTLCEFTPGESCGCCKARDFNKIRAEAGRENFWKKMTDNWVDRVLAIFEREIVEATGYKDLSDRFNDLVAKRRILESDTLHICLDTRAINRSENIDGSITGYSDHMQVLFSMEDNVVNQDSYISSRQIIPGYKGDTQEGHLYAILPIFESKIPLGYAISRDCLPLVESKGLQKYQNRLSFSLQKYRSNLSLTTINGQLVKKISKDALTNVKNRVAYEEEIEKIQSRLDDGIRDPLGIVMFDINGLKDINDKLGHEAGDEYIVSSCRLICSVFNYSPVFRIGGDEFVCILNGKDYENRDRNLHTMREIMQTLKISNGISAVKRVSIASGMAILEDDDVCVNDVFKRADALMYEDKIKMKGNAR